jgi:branched-chain amino acid transport system permease protein
MKRRWIIILFIASFVIILPFILNTIYSRHILITSAIFMISAMGLNFIMGFMGETPFGYPVFLGIGAYTTALGYVYLGTSFWIGLLAAPIAAGIAAFLIGYPSLRLRGPYFAIVTLAFALIVELILTNWVSFTRGPMGISGIPFPRIKLPGIIDFEFKSELSCYFLMLALVLICLYVVYRLINSKSGDALLAIRENEEFAEALGINVFWHKMTSFIIGGMLGGVAGCAYAHYFNIVSPELVGFYYIVTLFSMVIIGGRGSIYGPIFGAFLFTALPEYLRVAKLFRMSIYGLLMLLGIIFMPQGINGLLKALIERFKRWRENGTP